LTRRGGTAAHRPRSVTRQEIFEVLRRAEDEADNLDRFADEGLGYIEDIVEAFDWLAPLAADAPDDADPDAPIDPGSRLLAEPDWQEPVRNPLRELGRNDPCPCGSGKKYKKCCLGK
jgi:SEC-C motif-containing protein